MLQIITLLLPLLNKLIPDPEKRLEAQNEILKLASEQQGKIYESMKEVMVADSESDSAYTRAARPTIVYWSLGMISIIVLLAPMGYDSLIISALTKIPEQLWTLMTVGTGLFVAGRSAEKAINNYGKQ